MFLNGSKNLFKEQYYTGIRRYYCVREDCRPGPKKTISKNGSKNLFKEQYYTGIRRYYCVREDCRPGPKKTIYKNVMVLH